VNTLRNTVRLANGRDRPAFVSFLNCSVNMNRRTFNAQRPTLNIQRTGSLDVERWTLDVAR
jgi:hypothetical protein